MLLFRFTLPGGRQIRAHGETPSQAWEQILLRSAVAQKVQYCNLEKIELLHGLKPQFVYDDVNHQIYYLEDTMLDPVKGHTHDQKRVPKPGANPVSTIMVDPWVAEVLVP